MARQERTIKRLWIALILVIVLLVGSNCAWLWYESQFSDESWTVTQDVDGGDGGDATINDGIHMSGFGGGNH